MEVIKSLGDGIPDVVGPTYQAYGAILQQPDNKAAIDRVKKETFSYGPHERQKLDLYTPPPGSPNPSDGGARPILLFTYGGGFAMGDKILQDIPGGVVYANLGAFFASKIGFETIIADYRLLRHGAKYPSGGEDVGLVFGWIRDRYRGGQKRDVYALANSAGAVHLLTWLFAPQFADQRLTMLDGSGGLELSKVVLLGCPCRFDYNGGMRPMLETYYGGEGPAKEAEPTALMLAAVDGGATTLSKPAILIAVSELDPDYIVEPGREFSQTWVQNGGSGDFLVLDGHNHISPPLSLGTGAAHEERWGYRVARWLNKGTL